MKYIPAAMVAFMPIVALIVVTSCGGPGTTPIDPNGRVDFKGQPITINCDSFAEVKLETNGKVDWVSSENLCGIVKRLYGACEMRVVGRHVQNGIKCEGDFVATGMEEMSLTHPKVECAKITWDCE